MLLPGLLVNMNLGTACLLLMFFFCYLLVANKYIGTEMTVFLGKHIFLLPVYLSSTYTKPMHLLCTYPLSLLIHPMVVVQCIVFLVSRVCTMSNYTMKSASKTSA